MNQQDETMHELRTALAVIRGRAQISNRRVQRDGANDQYVIESNNQIINETRRIEVLLGRLERSEPLPSPGGDVQVEMSP